MLWMIAVVMIILWMLGLVTGFTMSNFAYILLFIAIVAMLVQIEDDCSNYGSDRKGKRYLKRQLISRSRKILPKLALLSGEKISQPTIVLQTYREE